MRLHKALAQAGVASRRASENLIREGRVRVNGETVTQMGVSVDPERDVVAVDGHEVQLVPSWRYIKLHKPVGYLSVMRDDRGRRALMDLVPDAGGLHPVGRLDLDSEGLLLLTNDGALTQRLTHPRYEHTKEYLVLVQGLPSPGTLRALREGVSLEDGKTAPAEVERRRETRWGRAPRGQSWLRITVREGRKRQIRRMCGVMGHTVKRLIRVRIGPIELGDLPLGAHRRLTRVELRRLRANVGELARSRRS